MCTDERSANDYGRIDYATTNYGCISAPDVRFADSGRYGDGHESTALLRPQSRSDSSVFTSCLNFSPLRFAHSRKLSVLPSAEAKHLPLADDRGTFSKRDKVVIAMLAFANLSATVIYSCIAPFFPSEAAMKNATETSVGLIFGIFELTIFLVSPIVGRMGILETFSGLGYSIGPPLGGALYEVRFFRHAWAT
ncbi:unnamed protein product [Soboliphyme baturini]|uniref:MFS domain-containing protein n=1 Tax=Soboliphyme baturini TaxID=241478 RepID=A0A183IXH2_9BILA|nr:unnamed protein product [Soboliphyme baturini]